MLKRVVTRRLPGFRFEAESPPLAEWLPRMDVACFVGFAASGPLDVPVAVESAAHFEAVFGREAALAWDAREGAQSRAQLAPAVRAFFENGGRRCWIVRVARTVADDAPGANPLNRARENFFPVPSLAACVLDEAGGVREIVPAFARARSEGSWSDALEVGAGLLSRPFQVRSLSLADDTLEIYQDSPGELAPGDLLRLTFDEGTTLFLFVNAITLAAPGASDARRAVKVSCKNPVWLQAVSPGSPPSDLAAEATARIYTFEPENPGAGGAAQGRTAASAFASQHQVRFVSDEGATAAGDDGAVSIELKVSLGDAPPPGSIVTISSAAGLMLLVVAETGVAGGAESGAGEAVRLTGQCFRVCEPQEWLTEDRIAQAERLTFELRVRSEGDYALTLGELGFAAPHARFWGQLPTDAEVYRADETAPVNEPTEHLWQPVGVVRFPVAAGDAGGGVFFLPLAMSSLAADYLGAARLPGGALERDGLAVFDAKLFLDAELADAGVNTLMQRADHIRYLGTTTRPLRAIHAALSIEEVTLISAPDAAHRGWTRAAVEPPPPPERSKPLPRPEWWTFLDCRKHAGRIPLVHRPLRSQFLECGLRVIERPQLKSEGELSESGTFTLNWKWKQPKENFRRATFVIEESGSPTWVGSSVIYRGEAESYTLYGRRAGDYYYRVRVEVEGADDGRVESSDWSTGVVVRVGAGQGWRIVSEEGFDASALLAVQRGLLRMCAARADLMAVLSLPAHYREDKSLEHVESLKGAAGAAGDTSGVAPLGAGEAGAFSYGALYHPWLVSRDAHELEAFRHVAPDGAACGLIAARALSRGAWIAPANEPLRGAVSLTPPVVRRRWLDLQLAQINLIRQEPRGFLAMNADTLSDEEELRQISVRRLLILLRRLAIRHGSTYVFEPNSPAFRRLVQRGFESVMDQLFARGAFAGATPAASYQVVTGAELNTRQSVDLGRFIVELRVAPSLPLTFLTIRLVQTGERGFVTEGR